MDRLMSPKWSARFCFFRRWSAVFTAAAIPTIPPTASPAAATGHAPSTPDTDIRSFGSALAAFTALNAAMEEVIPARVPVITWGWSAIHFPASTRGLKAPAALSPKSFSSLRAVGAIRTRSSRNWLSVKALTPSVRPWTASLAGSTSPSYMAIPAPSAALFNNVTSPARLSIRISAILCAAPEELLIASVSFW